MSPKKSALRRYFPVLLLAALPVLAQAALFRTAQDVRARIDRIEAATLSRLMAASDQARSLNSKAIAHAVFDATKVSIGITGGGGTGVAVDRRDGSRLYMHMGTGGLNFGLGGQVYQIVFLFSDELAFTNFVEHGWEASASANAVAGRTGANAGASFNNGVAVYQITGAGLMLQADISGTKYWRSRKLNSPKLR